MGLAHTIQMENLRKLEALEKLQLCFLITFENKTLPYIKVILFFF